MPLRLLIGVVLLLVACAGPGAAPPTAKPAASTGGAAVGAPAKAPGAYTANGEADGSSGKVSLTGMDSMKFQPNTITKAKAGSTISVEMKNGGATVHSIMSPGLGLASKVTVNPGQTGTATFTVPNAPGAYQFWCPEPGHAEAGMVGQVVVQ
jgi:uncharacterized cupredoxin-like copper-binding protein